MPETLLAVDQGTTSTRAIVFSKGGDILSQAQKELKLIYPHKGWVEQDAEVIWQDTLSCLRDVLRAYPDTRVMGITNQRETTIVWHRATGKPLYNAIVWQDRRTADICARLRQEGREPWVSGKTGLRLDPYFSATKLVWILDHVQGAREQAAKGELCFGTVDSYLLWHLTEGKVHATDATNASRTMLFNIHTQDWDDELLALFDIPKAMLPDVKDTVAEFGIVPKTFFGHDIRIGALIGDQQAALMGQACFKTGQVKSTYGTGCFMLMNTGGKARPSSHQLLTTVAYRLNGVTTYALEGSIFVAGAAIQWLRDNLKIITHAAESEVMAASVPDNNGVYFVPALTGLGAPYWAPEARGAIIGLTRESTAAHIVRAALEAQAYQTRDILGAFTADAGMPVTGLRIDGGLAANKFVCQFLADMLDTVIEVPAITETTALGAAYAAGMSAGVFSSLDDIALQWHAKQRYHPALDAAERIRLYDGWCSAVKRVL